MLQRAFITAALDAGVPLRDVQEAASHADPRTTMRSTRSGRPGGMRRVPDRSCSAILTSARSRDEGSLSQSPLWGVYDVADEGVLSWFWVRRGHVI